MLLRAQTKTREDVFGDCLYEIDEVGLPAPETDRRKAGEMDGVRCIMLGGSGPAARKGFTVVDSVAHIERDIATGIVEIIPAAKRAGIVAYYDDKKLDGTPRKVTGTGVMEM